MVLKNQAPRSFFLVLLWFHAIHDDHDYDTIRRVGTFTLRAFTSDSSRQLNIFWHDGDSFCVDRAQVGVFKQASQVRFWRFLQRQDGVRLESQVRLEVLSDFSDQALEWQFADQEFGRFLVFSVKIRRL